MENEKLNKGDMVLVKWYGQCQRIINDARFTYVSECYLNDVETCTLGFMVAEDNRAIILTPNIHKYSEHSQDYMVEGIFTIPKSMVIEVKKLS